jgi:hypothetical protein
MPNIEAGDPRVEKRPADVIGAVRSMEDVVALVDARSAKVSGETLVGIAGCGFVGIGFASTTPRRTRLRRSHPSVTGLRLGPRKMLSRFSGPRFLVADRRLAVVGQFEIRGRAVAGDAWLPSISIPARGPCPTLAIRCRAPMLIDIGARCDLRVIGTADDWRTVALVYFDFDSVLAIPVA